MAWSPDYCTVDELKAYLRIPDADVLDDTELGLDVAAASRAIDRTCRRQFGSADAVRYYTPEWDAASGRYVVRCDDFLVGEGVGLAVDIDGDQTYASTVVQADYRFLPLNAPADGRPYGRITLASSVAAPLAEGSVRLSTTFGWAAVPDTVKKACLIQAARFSKRRESIYGVAGSPDMGNELRLQDRVDPDVAVMLKAYRLQAWA